MEHKKSLDDLHKQSLGKIDEYLASKEHLPKEQIEKLHEAKSKWQVAHTDLMEFLLYLETLEL